MVADNEIATNAKKSSCAIRDQSLCPSFFAAAGLKNARLRFTGIGYAGCKCLTAASSIMFTDFLANNFRYGIGGMFCIIPFIIRLRESRIFSSLNQTRSLPGRGLVPGRRTSRQNSVNFKIEFK